MLHIEWWHNAAYRYMSQLAASGFAWEYLRRNDWQTLALTRRQDAKQLKSFAHRWGLLFPKRP